MRFPEFADEWKQTTLGETCSVIGGGTPSTDVDDYWNGDIQWFTPSEIGVNKFVSRSERTITEQGMNNSGAKLLPLGTILLTTRATIGEASIATCPCTTNQGCQSLVINRWITTTEFVYQKVETLKRELFSRANGSTFKEISASEVRSIPISLPSLAEQEKIASFLSLIDERIQSCSETITQMKSLRISFYRTISHQRKQEWQNIFLRDILTERKENNSMHYDVYSVSVSRGIVNQIEHLGRSFAAKDTSHYNTVHFGDLVYTKSPTGRFPYGIVKQSRVKSAVAVSPLYGVYIPNNYYIGVVLNNFFESSVRTSNYLAPLIQKGAKNTMNITTQHFLDNKILLPTSSEEQKKMADYLILLDERIEVEEELLKQYEMQKKYLLRQMFI